MQNYLVVSALGNDRPGIVDELSKAILESGCSIVDSRMTVLGGEFAIIVLISGNWNMVAKMENYLPGLQERLGLTIITKRTEKRQVQPNLLPYVVEVVSIDNPGIVHRLANFFSSRNINIEDLQTGSYAAAHTGTPMFSVHMVVGIPADLSIAGLRDQFLDFCDELNLDGILEPLKR